jgi:hypothetical protein
VCESDLSSHLKRFGNHSDDSVMSFHGEVEWLDSQKHSGADRVVRRLSGLVLEEQARRVSEKKP